MNRYCDLAPKRAQLPGEKVSLDNVLNKEIIVHGFYIAKSKYKKNTSGQCLTIQFKFNHENEFRVLFTGSEVLMSQAKEVEDHLPFATTIVKIDKYFSFS